MVNLFTDLEFCFINDTPMIDGLDLAVDFTYSTCGTITRDINRAGFNELEVTPAVGNLGNFVAQDITASGDRPLIPFTLTITYTGFCGQTPIVQNSAMRTGN